MFGNLMLEHENTFHVWKRQLKESSCIQKQVCDFSSKQYYNALSAHEKAGTFLAETENAGSLTYKANYEEM